LSSDPPASYRRTMRSVVLMLSMLACGAVACSASSSTCISAGTSVAVTRANGAGACPASVVAGVTSLNGSETFVPQKALSCGVTHFNIPVDFFDQDSTHESCQGADVISFQDLAATGGTGASTMTITCGTDISCTETFDATFATQ